MQRYNQELDAALARYPVGFDKRKLLQAFKRGEEAGTIGEAAPTLLTLKAQIEAPWMPYPHFPRDLMIPKPQNIVLGETDGFRKGYISGLKDFVADKGIHLDSTSYLSPEQLLEDEVLLGFLRGVQHTSPQIDREPLQPAGTIMNKLQQFNRAKVAKAQQVGGYRLGIAVSMARDFGVVLNLLEMPGDNDGYQALIQGLEAKPRQAVRSQIYDYGADFDIRTHLDERRYEIGLEAWFTSHELDRNLATRYRNPQLLQAFKAGFDGGGLPQYIELSRNPLASAVADSDKSSVEEAYVYGHSIHMKNRKQGK